MKPLSCLFCKHSSIELVTHITPVRENIEVEIGLIF